MKEEIQVDEELFVKAWLEAASRRGSISDLSLKLLLKPGTVREIATELGKRGWKLPPLRIVQTNERFKRGPKEHVTLRLDKRILFQARVYAAREETSLGDMIERLMIHGFIARGGTVDPFRAIGDADTDREIAATKAEMDWLESFNRRMDTSGFNRFLEIEGSDTIVHQDELKEEE